MDQDLLVGGCGLLLRRHVLHHWGLHKRSARREQSVVQNPYQPHSNSACQRPACCAMSAESMWVTLLLVLAGVPQHGHRQLHGGHHGLVRLQSFSAHVWMTLQMCLGASPFQRRSQPGCSLHLKTGEAGVPALQVDLLHVPAGEQLLVCGGLLPDDRGPQRWPRPQGVRLGGQRATGPQAQVSCSLRSLLRARVLTAWLHNRCTLP